MDIVIGTQIIFYEKDCSGFGGMIITQEFATRLAKDRKTMLDNWIRELEVLRSAIIEEETIKENNNE